MRGLQTARKCGRRPPINLESGGQRSAAVSDKLWDMFGLFLPLDEDLEDSCTDESVQQAKNSVVDIPEGADAELHQQENEDGNQRSEQGSGPNWDDLVAGRIGVLWEDLRE